MKKVLALVLVLMLALSVAAFAEKAGEGITIGVVYKQSGNPYLPQVHEPLRFEESLKEACRRRLLCLYGSVTKEEADPFADSGDFSGIGWFVGPEGGFTAEEEAQMREHAFRPLHMNGWILRAETPGTYAVANEKIGDLLEDCTTTEMQDFLRILEDVKKAVRRK